MLYTPFRYPPLKYGSRFGTKYEPSLWYGSLELDTAIAETAFYRFNFIRACNAELGIIESSHSVFSAQIKTKQGIDLTQPPFSEFTSIISSPESYQASQSLGTEMRQGNIEAFFYESGRDINKKTISPYLPQKRLQVKNPLTDHFNLGNASSIKRLLILYVSALQPMKQKAFKSIHLCLTEPYLFQQINKSIS